MDKLNIERIKLFGISEVLKEEIDQFIERNNGTFYHETAFNNISARTFGTELSYFIASRSGKIVGVCPCHSVKEGMLQWSYSNLTSKDLVYGGWVYDEAYVSLDQLYKGTRVAWNEALFVSSNIELDPKKPCKPSSVGKYSEALTAVLKVAGISEEELFQGFKHAQRNKIRKAVKNGILIEQVNPERISTFYDLLVELKVNLNQDSSPQDYFCDVFSYYHARGRAACLVAKHEGQNISTLIIITNKAFATIWMGGRKIGIPNNLYQNELMIWEAIRWALARGSEYFDFCTVDEIKHANLSRIKLSFAGEVKPYYHYTVKKLPFRILNRIGRLGNE